MSQFTTVVTGGAGFVGTHYLQRLAQEDGADNLISLDISRPKRPVADVDYRQVDIRDLSGLHVAAPIRRIIHLAAVHTTPGHLPWEYYDTNVTGAVQVARFAERMNVPTINFTSSISVYGPSEELKSEGSTPEPISDYGRSKRMAELILEDWQRHTGNRLIVTRPAVVFGYGEGGNFTRLAKLLQKGMFIYPGRRDTIKSCIYVGDLISWMMHAETIDTPYTLLNGAFSDRYRTEDIVAAFKQVAFPQAREITVPAAVLKTAAGLLRPLSMAGLGIHPERIEKLMKSTNVVSRWAEEQGLPTHDRLALGLEEWRIQSNGDFS